MVADQFERCVVDAFQKRLVASIFELADLARRRGEAATATGAGVFFRANQPIGRFEAIVEPVVDVAKLEELDVCELDDFERIGASVSTTTPAAQSSTTRSLGV